MPLDLDFNLATTTRMNVRVKATVETVMVFMRRNDRYKYQRLPPDDYRNLDAECLHRDSSEGIRKTYRHPQVNCLIIIVFGVISTALFVCWAVVVSTRPTTESQPCDTIYGGFQCDQKISHFWGQYSPYFSVPSEITTDLPAQCKITVAQILSRHGARDPTSSKTIRYNATIQKIHNNAQSYSKDYAFIKEYKYALGADQLSVFGEQQLVNSGIKFYHRYKQLAKNTAPFVRSSGGDRVVESAQNWTQGFHNARIADGHSDDAYPYNVIVISEDAGSNNTLDHGLCKAFEDGYNSKIASSAQQTWASIFTPPITARLNKNLPGANLSTADTIYMMDLCPFNTVASSIGEISRFCELFTEKEWHSYDYYQSLGKYYGYSWGNPLGPTQGVGFSNELIARFTDTPVNDHTSTNSTLDSSNSTFPLGGWTRLYADFSHDNDMTAIFAALGLYNETKPLQNTTIENVEKTNGYSASWTVPFAARAYFEKMVCVGVKEELVRVIVNDRVLPLKTCGGDALGRCKLTQFIENLSFAQSGGYWDKCFL